MIKVECPECDWRGELSMCRKIRLYDAARCPHCDTAVIAHKPLQRALSEKRVPNYRYPVGS